METNNQFTALPPIPESLVIGGETIDVSPLRVGEIPAFARAVRPVAAKLAPDPDWIRLLSEDGESVIMALAIACRRPPDWVSTLALDDAILLAEAVFGANADFFIRRVVPEVTRVSNRIGALINGTIASGATPSSTSSGPDTTIPTS